MISISGADAIVPRAKGAAARVLLSSVFGPYARDDEFGAATRLVRAVTGPVLLWTSKREDRRLACGKTYEPPTFVERRNWAT